MTGRSLCVGVHLVLAVSTGRVDRRSVRTRKGQNPARCWSRIAAQALLAHILLPAMTKGGAL